MELDEVFNLLTAIWEFAIFTSLQKIEKDMQELNWEIEDEDESYEEPVRLTEPSQYSSFHNKFNFTEETVTKEALISYTLNQQFQTTFHLPNTEKIISSMLNFLFYCFYFINYLS